MFNFKEFLNEISFNVVPTEYDPKKIIHEGNEIEENIFTSNNGNEYSVYFSITTENDIKLPNGNYLSRYTDLNKMPTIFFSLTERDFDSSFNNLTNKKEFLEVMGKVVFIIRNYIDSHDYTVYTYSTNSNDKKDIFYNYYHKEFTEFFKVNLPSLNYIINDGEYENVCYLIKDYHQFRFENKYIQFENSRFYFNR